MSDNVRASDKATFALGSGVGLAIAHLLVNFNDPWTPIVSLLFVGAIYGLLALTQ
jgi:hypothetical protein